MALNPEYVLPGERITSLQSFYRVIGEIVNGPGGYFGNNLDALIDCLRGGFGTPAQFRIRWSRSEISRQAMNHADAVLELTNRLERCDPANRPKVTDELNRAKQSQGQTTFEWVVEILRGARNVELTLE